MNLKALRRYSRLIKKPPTWSNLHRRRALYNDIMNDMRFRLRVFCVFGTLCGCNEPEDTLEYAMAEMQQLRADIKVQDIESSADGDPLSPAQQMSAAATVEALLRHGTWRYKRVPEN